MLAISSAINRAIESIVPVNKSCYQCRDTANRAIGIVIKRAIDRPAEEVVISTELSIVLSS